jgi:hypothetical protein
MEDWLANHPILTVMGFVVSVLFLTYKMLSAGKSNQHWITVDWNTFTVASMQQSEHVMKVSVAAQYKLKEAWRTAWRKQDDYFGEHFVDAVHAARFTPEEVQCIRGVLPRCAAPTLCNYFELGLKGTYMDNFRRAIGRT